MEWSAKLTEVKITYNSHGVLTKASQPNGGTQLWSEQERDGFSLSIPVQEEEQNINDHVWTLIAEF